jgi:16S rRNA C1402 N4-methylase RsmH
MALSIKPDVKPEKIIIDLTGEQGNAFNILSAARKLSKQIGLDTDSILDSMQRSDYAHLVRTFDLHFGAFVELQMSRELMRQIHPAHDF